MTEKKLVVRDEAARTHVYTAAYSEDQTQRQLVSDLTDVESLSDGGYLTMRVWSGRVPHTIEISSIGGKLSYAPGCTGRGMTRRAASCRS